jgi:anti-sigma-K factor RskA
MSVDDERLMAFADGELSGAERAEVEAALADDASLREKLAAHQRLRTRLSGAFDGALDEPVPASLLAAVEKPRTAEVVNLGERRAARWSVREWGAMAASVVLGLFVGIGVMNTQAPLIAPSESGLVARGALAQALETQLASDEADAVRIGLSFRDTDGRYCRTFDLTEGGTAGLACREGDAWNVAMTAAGAGGGEVRQAAASEQILSAVDAMIAGEPLDAAGETQARDAGWGK